MIMFINELSCNSYLLNKRLINLYLTCMIICSGTRNMEMDARSSSSTSSNTNCSNAYAARITPLALQKGSIMHLSIT